MMYQILYPGDTHPAISNVKDFFTSFGFSFKRPETDFYDDDLKNAVNALKRSIGLSDDGVINSTVWQNINTIDANIASQKGLEVSFESIDKDWIIRDKTAVEAGYVNNPNDLGKETNHGITYAVANTPAIKEKLVELFNWNGNMRDLTREMAYWIYEREYWDKLRLNDVIKHHVLLADKLFDIGINAGVGRAALWLQQILTVMNNKGKLYPDLKPDGAVGNITIGALNNYVEKRGHRAIPRLLLALFCMQGQHYINISLSREENETFTYGWYDRMEHNIDFYYEGLWKK